MTDCDQSDDLVAAIGGAFGALNEAHGAALELVSGLAHSARDDDPSMIQCLKETEAMIDEFAAESRRLIGYWGIDDGGE